MPSSIPTLGRVNQQLRTNLALLNLGRSNSALLKVQEELSSGFRVNRPSDDPLAAHQSLQLAKRIRENDRFASNVRDGAAQLMHTDAALGDIQDLVVRAKQVALQQETDTSDAQTRRLAAAEVEQLLEESINVANRRVGNRYIFGGHRTNAPPFAQVAGFVAYRGDDGELAMGIAEAVKIRTNLTGDEAFGAMSTEVEGRADLNPGVRDATLLADLNGGKGVELGRIRITDSAGRTAEVDLSEARTMGDVIDAFQEALRSDLNYLTVQLEDREEPANSGKFVTGIRIAPKDIASTDNRSFTVSEADGHDTARDLGILGASQDFPLASPAPGGPTTFPMIIGSDLDPRLTLETSVDAVRGANGVTLGAVLRQDGRIRIENGGQSGEVDLSGALTVQDLINKINGAGLNVEARINGSDGLDIVSRLNGARLRVRDVAAANPALEQDAAAALGWDLAPEAIELADLNGGLGITRAGAVSDGHPDFETVGAVPGDDLRIRLFNAAGAVAVQADVDLGEAKTLKDVIDAINKDPAAQGKLTASFDAANKRLLITATDPATARIKIDRLNGAFSATDLGIETEAAGATLTGRDLNYAGVRTDSVFTALVMLRDALQSNDLRAIQSAHGLLNGAEELTLTARGEVGGRSKRLEMTETRLADERVLLEELDAETRGTDMAEAVIRLQKEQQVFQASLGATATIFQLSLLDFLR